MTSWDHVYLGDRLDGSPIFHQQLHDFDAIFLAGNVQWSKAVLCKRQLVSGRHVQPLSRTTCITRRPTAPSHMLCPEGSAPLVSTERACGGMCMDSCLCGHRNKCPQQHGNSSDKDQGP